MTWHKKSSQSSTTSPTQARLRAQYGVTKVNVHKEKVKRTSPVHRYKGKSTHQ